MSTPLDQLAARIRDRSAPVAILGLGYVGLPLLRAFFDGGHPVIGFDIDPGKIEKLRRGENYLRHLSDDLVAPMASSPKAQFTSDPAALAKADALILCVPTPLGKHLEPDLSFVADTAELCAKALRAGQLVALESSTYPGTTREIVLPALEKAGAALGLVHGTDYVVAYSPEREDPGRKTHNTRTIPKLVGGLTPRGGELARDLYAHAVAEAILVSSAEVAEAAKILENTYRAVNIALVNELKTILTPMKVDVFEVIEAAATKPFGFQAFWPGPGLGGHCIPIDPYYLTWKAREVGCQTRFIELAGEINHAMPRWVVDRLAEALNDAGKPVRGAKVLVAGLAYKPDVDDVRETPAAHLIDLLRARGAEVTYHDPHVPVVPPMREHPSIVGMKSAPWTAENLAAQDAVLVCTHHAAVDWDLAGAHAKLVVDTRGLLRKKQGVKARVVQA